MSKPSMNIRKCFALASCMGSALKAGNNLPPYYEKLNLQVNRAMRVFNYKDRELYHSISNDVADIWGVLAKENSHIIPEDAIPELVNGFSHLISAKMFKDFLGLSQPSFGDVEMEDIHFIYICKASLNLGTELNKLFNTKSPTISITKKKVKKKKLRHKSKSKKELAHLKTVEEAKASKERKAKFFANIREKARIAKEKENEKKH